MTKTSRKKIVSAPKGEMDPLFAPIARAFEKDRDVTISWHCAGQHNFKGCSFVRCRIPGGRAAVRSCPRLQG